MYFNSIRCHVSYASYCVTINTGVFLWKMCSDRRKNHGCGQKKLEGTSSARFGLRTAAKCGELKHCADRVGSRTDNKNERSSGRAGGRAGGRAYADFTTKISRIDRLPNLLSNGAPL